MRLFLSPPLRIKKNYRLSPPPPSPAASAYVVSHLSPHSLLQLSTLFRGFPFLFITSKKADSFLLAPFSVFSLFSLFRRALPLNSIVMKRISSKGGIIARNFFPSRPNLIHFPYFYLSSFAPGQFSSFFRIEASRFGLSNPSR